MEIKVLEIVGKNSYWIRERNISRYDNVFINKEPIKESLINNDFVFSLEDNLEYLPKAEIVKYIRGNEEMTAKQFKSKPQSYWEESSEDEILEAIENRKSLEGFEPVYTKPSLQKVSLDIVGFIQDTGSRFITSVIQSIYSKSDLLYTVTGKEIALDEYFILKDKYSDHSNFETPDRDYLRFTKINGNYAFSDGKPFGDFHYRSNFTSLEEAKEEEKSIRESVKKVVDRCVFKEEPTLYKTDQIISRLILIKGLKTKIAIREALDLMVEDMKNYINETK